MNNDSYVWQEMTEFSDIDLSKPACNKLWKPVKERANLIAATHDSHFCGSCTEQLEDTRHVCVWFEYIATAWLFFGILVSCIRCWNKFYITTICYTFPLHIIRTVGLVVSAKNHIEIFTDPALRICGRKRAATWTLRVSPLVRHRQHGP